MARRKWTSIDELPLVGGRPCLDFVNTSGRRAGERPRERLRSYPDWLVFLRRAGLIEEREARALERAAERQPAEAGRVLAAIVALREALYRVLRALTRAGTPAPADLARLNRYLQRALRRRRLAWSVSGPAWVREPPAETLEAGLEALAEDASELLTQADREHVRQCGECDWLYLDTSRSKRRQWCKKACGDRVKARRYYRRKRAGSGGTPSRASR